MTRARVWRLGTNKQKHCEEFCGGTVLEGILPIAEGPLLHFLNVLRLEAGTLEDFGHMGDHGVVAWS